MKQWNVSGTDDWGRETEAVEGVVRGTIGGERMKHGVCDGRDDWWRENESWSVDDWGRENEEVWWWWGEGAFSLPFTASYSLLQSL